MITATQIKKIDNKLTYAVGYRNLYNIVALAFASVMFLYSVPNSVPYYISLTIGVLAGKWILTQLHENVDTIAVSEI